MKNSNFEIKEITKKSIKYYQLTLNDEDLFCDKIAVGIDDFMMQVERFIDDYEKVNPNKKINLEIKWKT